MATAMRGASLSSVAVPPSAAAFAVVGSCLQTSSWAVPRLLQRSLGAATSSPAAPTPKSTPTASGSRLWPALSGLVFSFAAAAVAAPTRRRRAGRRPAVRRARSSAGGGLAAAECVAKSSFAGAPHARGAVLQPRSRVALGDSWRNPDDEDGPDSFFARRRPQKEPVQPGYNSYDSPSRVSLNEPVVFFFPRHGGKYNGHAMDPDDKGQVVPKLFKRTQPSQREKSKFQRNRKRQWRKMSNRMQDEIRFKRFPRNESGKITLGQFKKTLDPKYNPNN